MSTIESEPTPAPGVEVSAAATTVHVEAAPTAVSTALEGSVGAHTLEKLLAEVPDESLRAKLMEAYARAKPKRFGLVYEDHEPDAVTLPAGTPIRPGDLVRWETAGKAGRQLFQVETTGRRGLSVRPVLGTPGAGELGETVPVEDATELRVVKAWGAPVYPGLSRIGEPIGEWVPGTPEHMLIQSENLHALQALGYTHAGKVNLIYIDPPYNTGNKTWIYNDRYVVEKDAFRHSKWLAFMEHRLSQAKKLLADTGVIVVAIGDEEHHRLRMLMDEVFGSENFISDIVWQGGRKNDSRYISNGADYMLVYGKSTETMTAADIRWREQKAGIGEALAAAESIWTATGGDHEEATKQWRAWMRKFKSSGAATDAVTRFTKLDTSGRPIRTDRDLSWPGGGGPRYDVLHPTTGLPCAVPTGGWRFPDPLKMQEEIAADRIYFGPDHTTQPAGLVRLEDFSTQVAESVFIQDRNGAPKHLDTLLGSKRFPFPKDYNVLMRFIRLMAGSDAVILDFFGGSGSTMEAVIRLNAEDGGTRQAILVTNNELAAVDDAKLRKAGHLPGDDQYEAQGVCRHVTIPRLTSVVTGRRPDGTEHKYGAVAGARFSAWKLNYLDPISVEMGAQFAAIAPLLWAESGCLGPVIEEEPFTWEVTDYYGVLTSATDLGGFVESVIAKSEANPFTAWIVADTDAQWNAAARALPPQVNARRLWSHYVRSFEINVPGRSR
ncbi:site-specific DNA-methyltransferase [Kocuria rosea]|uniref:Site-specific DNA-methyltransferase n=1 Tax=Kocuria rosea TaxID=1275 RepID=A0A4R5YBX4_KOCRO|nr:site-specific DNA-methyltransferase [Kocuria rosea]TDL42481.1 site-specific DNA-methyltransferase [Kocuria rosea]